MPIKDLPLDAQPREKLAQRGAAALSDAELLAIILRTGMAGKSVLQMAQELLELPGAGGLAGLLAASHQDLAAVKGLGPAKRAELMAVLELARRATAQQLREREVFPPRGRQTLSAAASGSQEPRDVCGAVFG